MHPIKPGTAPTSVGRIPANLPGVLRTVADTTKIGDHHPGTTGGALMSPATNNQPLKTSKPPVPPLRGPLGSAAGRDASMGGRQSGDSRPSTQPGGRRRPGSIVVGDHEFQMPPLRDESCEIKTPRSASKRRVTATTTTALYDDGPDFTVQGPGKPLNGNEPHRLPDSSSKAFSGTAYYTPKNFNNAVIDSWPVRPGTSSTGAALVATSPRKSEGVVAPTGRAAPKPPLLKSIEDYVSRELAMLTHDEVENGGRLRVYREMMRLFADNFTTYGPFIGNVMHEYERQLERRNLLEQRVLQLEVALQTQRLETSDAVHEVRDELVRTKKGNDEERLAFESMAHYTQERQAEADAVIRDVMGEMNDLRDERAGDLGKMLALVRAVKAAESRLKTVMERNGQLRSDLEQMDDLKACLSDAETRLSAQRDLYQDTVPRSQHDTIVKGLQKQIQKLKESEMQLRRLSATRAAMADRANRVAKQLTKERGSYRNGGAMTPRPQLAPEVEKELVSELLQVESEAPLLTTAERLDACINELRKQRQINQQLTADNQELKNQITERVADSAAPPRRSTASVIVPRIQSHAELQWLQKQHKVVIWSAAEAARGRGLYHSAAPGSATAGAIESSPTQYSLPGQIDEQPSLLDGSVIPPYYWAIGTIPRLESTLLQTTTTLATFWEFRAEQQGRIPVIHDCVYAFFSGNAPKKGPGRAVNFLESCRRYRHSDARIELFLGVLEGIYPERLQLDVQAFIEDIRFEARAIAAQEKSRRIRKSKFMEVIGPTLIDYKTDEYKAQLKKLLGPESTLVVEDLCNAQHPFIEAIARQGCDERIDLYTRLVENLTNAATPEGTLTYDDVNNAIYHTDPYTAETVVEELCRPDPLSLQTAALEGTAASPDASPLANTPLQPPVAVSAVPLSLVLERLQTVAIVRGRADDSPSPTR
jgi:hypothetical protein